MSDSPESKVWNIVASWSLEGLVLDDKHIELLLDVASEVITAEEAKQIVVDNHIRRCG